MNTIKSYRLDQDRLVLRTRFEPTSNQYILDLRSAYDRVTHAWVDSAQFAAHVRALTVHLADDGWQLEENERESEPS